MNSAQQGWECPKCGTVYEANISSCHVTFNMDQIAERFSVDFNNVTLSDELIAQVKEHTNW